jgi:hypothetical protein
VHQLVNKLNFDPNNEKGVRGWGRCGLSYVSRGHRKSKRLLIYIINLNKEECNLTFIPLTACFIQ